MHDRPAQALAGLRGALAGAGWNGAVVLAILGLVLLSGGGLPASRGARASDRPPSGIVSEVRERDGGRALVVRSEGRFELWLDGGGIVAWYDLRRDPQRARNLAAGSRLVEHRLGGAPFFGALTVEEQNPARVRVRLHGQGGSVTYTIWAGGQAAIETSGPIATELRRDPAASTGAALKPLQQASGGQGASFVLYLDAWTGESAALEDARLTPGFARRDGALVGRAAGQPLRVTLPEGLARQPRIEVAAWPGPDFVVRRAGRTLVAGHDYVAHWDAASGTLLVQYFGLLPPGLTPGERTFEIAEGKAGETLSLGIAGRTLDEVSGMLVVDADLPSIDPGVETTADVFRIPYIQSSAPVTVTAAQTGGAGVEFVLNGESVGTAFGSSVQMALTLPQMGEHTLTAYIVNAAGQRINGAPDDSIPVIGYGRILVSIGDSITAGKNGHMIGPNGLIVGPGPHAYPIPSFAESPAESADRRNIYQLDNYFGPGNSEGEPGDRYYRGYQLRLNDLLAACSEAPVFILNDGLSGSTTAYTPDSGRTIDERSVLAKAAAYSDHIQTLGATQALLMVGTNDATPPITLDEYRDGLSAAIDALQDANPGLTLWVARVPWRDDSPANRQLMQDFNAEIQAVVDAQNAPGNPVLLGPDFYGYFEQNQDFFLEANGGDDLHPNQDGLDAMADLWSDALCPAFPPENTPTPTSTATPTTTPTTAPAGTTTATPTQTATASPTPSRNVALPLVVR